MDFPDWPRDALLDWPLISLRGSTVFHRLHWDMELTRFNKTFGFDYESQTHMDLLDKRNQLWHAEADRRSAEHKAVANRTAKSSDGDDVPGRWYFITYTRPPSFSDPTAVLKSASRLVRSKAVSATQWAYSLELQKMELLTFTFAYLLHATRTIRSVLRLSMTATRLIRTQYRWRSLILLHMLSNTNPSLPKHGWQRTV